MLATREAAFVANLRSLQDKKDVAWLPDDPTAWIEREFYIPEAIDLYGVPQAIRLEPYQRAVIEQAIARDADADLPYSLVLWADLKKSAKSTIAAAVMLFMAWHHEWESCRVVGNDLKQADSRTFYYIRRAIELNPRLRSKCVVKNYHITLPNHTIIEAIAVDPKGEAGGGDLMVCFTELWAAKNEAAKRLWTETTLSPLKYGKSLRWCESYAGYTGESPILEQLYQSGVVDGAQVDVPEHPGLELYENASARMLTLWNTVPRCPWQTQDYYAQEEAVLTPSEFARVHRNEWASSEDAFVPAEWWHACQGDIPPVGQFESVVVGIDAGVSSDCFAIVAVARRGELCYPRYVGVWRPPQGGKLSFAAPEMALRDLARQYHVVEFAYDPYQLHDMATRLNGQIGYFRPFSQGTDRLVADKQLYDRIRDRRIVHDGDPTLTEHIHNANRKAEGDKLRLVKRAEHMKIDAAVALSMACGRAAFLNIG